MQTNNKLREAAELAKATFETLMTFPGDGEFVKTWAKLGRDAMVVALAEPPRNCDRYGEYKIVDEFERQMGKSPSRTADEQDEYMRENWFLFYKWLFALATEKEGGDNGNT